MGFDDNFRSIIYLYILKMYLYLSIRDLKQSHGLEWETIKFKSSSKGR